MIEQSKVFSEKFIYSMAGFDLKKMQVKKKTFDVKIQSSPSLSLCYFSVLQTGSNLYSFPGKMLFVCTEKQLDITLTSAKADDKIKQYFNIKAHRCQF